MRIITSLVTDAVTNWLMVFKFEEKDIGLGKVRIFPAIVVTVGTVSIPMMIKVSLTAIEVSGTIKPLTMVVQET